MRSSDWTMFAATLAVMASTGCGWSNSAAPTTDAGAVAVIDLDEVAHRLGSDRKIADSITQRQTALSAQLVHLAKSYTEQIAEQKKTLPAEGEQAQVTVASWEQQANANLNEVKQRAELELNNHRTQLMQQFRDQVKPVARRVAQRRGLTVIVTKNDAVIFDFVSAADITDEVVDELLTSAAAPEERPAGETPALRQAAAPTQPTR